MRTQTQKLSVSLSRMVIALVVALSGTLAGFSQVNYSVHDFAGKVSIKKSTGQTLSAKKNMAINEHDLILIGSGSSVVVKHNSKLYSCDKPGRYSPITLVYNARKAAGSNFGNVHRRISISNAEEEEGKIYTDVGKVTLALDEYDPAGKNMMIDAGVMAKYIASLAAAGKIDSTAVFPVPFKHNRTEDGGMMFEVEDNVPEPLYINVLKLVLEDGKVTLRISELGTPVGCYVLLPGQSIMRKQNSGIADNELHMVVATHYYFSIDDLIYNLMTELPQAFGQDPSKIKIQKNLPIYVGKI